MRKRINSTNSLRIHAAILAAIALLLGLAANRQHLKAVYSQSTPTANFRTYLPIVKNGNEPPVGPVGGTFTSFAIDPGQNDYIYAGNFGSGVYKTFDQGATWYRKNTGLGNLQIQSLATHPTSSSIVYAGTYGSGIYRSTNGGESWQASNGGVLTNHIIYDIEIDPSNPQRIFAASRISGSLVGYLSRSMDGGKNWTILLTGNSFSTPDYFYDVDIDPNNSSVVYLTAHQHGFYKSVNSGVSFSPINTGVTDLSARSFAIDPAHPGWVFGGVWHGSGVFVTWNGGAAWAKSSAGLPSAVKVNRLYLDPFGRLQKRLFSCTYGHGLYSSDNFAVNWSSRGLSGQGIYDFVIADGSPQRWYAATENNGIFRSTTGGTNWKSIMADLRLTNITGLIDFPEDGGALAAAIYGQGVFRVTDSGENWEPFNEGLTNLNVVSLAVAEGKLYAIGRGWLAVWEGSGWQSVGLPDASNSEFEAGVGWIRERVLLPDIAFEAEEGGAVQPTGAAWQNGRLLLGTAGSGLWALEDDNWQQVGLAGMTIEKMMPGFWEDVYLLTCLQGGDCGVYQFEQGEIIQNQTFGQTALPPALGISELPFEIETIDPTKLIYAISKSESCLWAVSEGNKVWITTDCGVGWIEHSFDWTVMSLAFDPLDSNLLLVGTRESGAFRVWIR